MQYFERQDDHLIFRLMLLRDGRQDCLIGEI